MPVRKHMNRTRRAVPAYLWACGAALAFLWPPAATRAQVTAGNGYQSTVAPVSPNCPAGTQWASSGGHSVCLPPPPPPVIPAIPGEPADYPCAQVMMCWTAGNGYWAQIVPQSIPIYNPNYDVPSCAFRVVLPTDLVLPNNTFCGCNDNGQNAPGWWVTFIDSETNAQHAMGGEWPWE